MIEEVLDIWEVWRTCPICITTNGFVKNDGTAVVGKGVAKQAVQHIPDFAKLLGASILKHGNVVQLIYPEPYVPEGPKVFSFPVKPAWGICSLSKSNVVPHMRVKFSPGDLVPGWAMIGDVETIARSLYELSMTNDEFSYFEVAWYGRVYLPRPGCGAGCLSWDVVKPLCAKYADWLVVVHKE